MEAEAEAVEVVVLAGILADQEKCIKQLVHPVDRNAKCRFSLKKADQSIAVNVIANNGHNKQILTDHAF